MTLSKVSILAAVTRMEREEPSDEFGGALLLHELTRAEYRAIARAADMGDGKINVDQWNGGIFAAGVIDPETKEPMFTIDEILAWPQRAVLWDEITRVATVILDLSAVGPAPLDPPSAD